MQSAGAASALLNVAQLLSGVMSLTPFGDVVSPAVVHEPWRAPASISPAYSTTYVTAGGVEVVKDQTGPRVVPLPLWATICQKYVVPLAKPDGVKEAAACPVDT